MKKQSNKIKLLDLDTPDLKELLTENVERLSNIYDDCQEFDTEEQAKVFLSSIPPVGYEYITEANIEIKNCILYYDGGHLNASGKILIYDENGEEILANIEEV